MVGESVMEYVTKRKLTLAGKELLETDAVIVDIAIKFGYECVKIEPTHFHKFSINFCPV
jgi:AraC-like DNA-binding protein